MEIMAAHARLLLVLASVAAIFSSHSLCVCRLLAEQSAGSPLQSLEGFTLDSVRDKLTRIEDSIVFALIERARYPRNAQAYRTSAFPDWLEGFSLAEVLVRDLEAVQAKAGRYQNPEEIAFFPNSLPPSLVPPYNFTKVLHPSAESVNVSNTIWNMYIDELLPLFTEEGDDGNYAAAVASDLVCLQALSRRIHYGRFVAEAKFRDSPNDYTPAINDKDTNTLTRLLTFESVEEMVRKRVEKKAMIFGQNVTLEDASSGTSGDSAYKIDPNVAGRLYREWVIPLTKVVEVDYLLLRLH